MINDRDSNRMVKTRHEDLGCNIVWNTYYLVHAKAMASFLNGLQDVGASLRGA